MEFQKTKEGGQTGEKAGCRRGSGAVKTSTKYRTHPTYQCPQYYGHGICPTAHTPACGSSDHQIEGSSCTGNLRIQ